MRRRGFLQSAGAGLLGAPLVARAAPRRPDILFVTSDDQSWLHTGASGDRTVRTPAFDRVARTGVRFTHTFCGSPSCTPSRGAMLTGQDIWRLREGGNLWSSLPADIPVYPDLLEAAGYEIGLQGKGWGPGDFKAGGRPRNPAGPPYKSFEEFFRALPAGKPFCFWFGSQDPHRPYEKGSGLGAGMRLDSVQVPPWLPDHPEVRADILDYYYEIQRYDGHLGAILDLLEKNGRLADTLVIVTSDNGMPFPRAKTNLYDSGTRMPLAVGWPARIPGGRVIDDLVCHADLAPTILEAAGLRPPPVMTGRSLLPTLLSRRQGRVDSARSRVFTARERHTQMRAGGLGYPMRAIRTYDHLYIRNFEPDRWPAGDPEHYGDIDNSPTKEFVIEHRDSAEYGRYYQWACARRPAEELYDLKKDPGQFVNVAGRAEYAEAQRALREALMRRLRDTGDPRATGAPAIWDTSPYYGGKGPMRKLDRKSAP